MASLNGRIFFCWGGKPANRSFFLGQPNSGASATVDSIVSNSKEANDRVAPRIRALGTPGRTKRIRYYPDAERAAGIKGTVLVGATVDERGNVVDTKVADR